MDEGDINVKRDACENKFKIQTSKAGLYTYNCKYISNYDGDTITFIVDLGFGCYYKLNVRVRGVDTPEIKSKDKKLKQKAKEAKQFTKKVLKSADSIFIRTYKTSLGNEKRSFTRYIADVLYIKNNKVFDLCEELISQGYGVKYIK